MAKSRFLAPCTLLTTSLSKMARVKPSEPTSLGTRSDARARCLMAHNPGVVAAPCSLVRLRNLAFVVSYAVVLSTIASVWAADFGTAEEAKAMLERAVAEVKEDKAKALNMFNKGEGGFKDRDLYVFCANAVDGIITAHPYGERGKQLRNTEGMHGGHFGETVMQNATEGTIKETTYWWPRHGTGEVREKTVFYTKAGDQICGVGYYKE